MSSIEVSEDQPDGRVARQVQRADASRLRDQMGGAGVLQASPTGIRQASITMTGHSIAW